MKRVLIDSGSRYSIMSKSILAILEQQSNQKFELRPSQVYLVSHTGDQLHIIGETIIPITIVDSSGLSHTLEQVYFQITDDIGKILIGAEVLIPRSGEVIFSSPSEKQWTRLDIPSKYLINQERISREVLAVHLNTTPSFYLELSQDVHLAPNAKAIVECLINQGIENVTRIKSNKDLICEINVEAIKDSTTIITQSNRKGFTRFEVCNSLDSYYTIPKGTIIGTGRQLTSEEWKTCTNLLPMYKTIADLDKLKMTNLEHCFCTEEETGDVCNIFFADRRGLTAFPNTDMVYLFDDPQNIPSC